MIEAKMKSKTAKVNYPVISLMKERWSPRMFSTRKVSRDDLMTLFEAARWAPSSSNLQPWRFIYAYKGTEEYEKIFSLLSDFNQSWVRNAQLLILTAIKEKMENGKENFHALHDLGLAVSQLVIQAQSMDIAVHQMAGVRWKEAGEKFNIPEGYHIVTAIAIGYYGGDLDDLSEKLRKQEEAPRERKPLKDIVHEGSWWGK